MIAGGLLNGEDTEGILEETDTLEDKEERLEETDTLVDLLVGGLTDDKIF